MSRNHGLYAALFAVALLVQALPNAADAAPPVPNGNITALRAAIANAAPGGTIVLFKNGTYTLDGTQLVITKQITIKGHGATIDGNDASGVIKIKSTGNLTLRNVIITGGAGHKGGGIDNAGTLTLSGNSSVTYSHSYLSKGGGIYNRRTGTLKLSDTSSVTNNGNYGEYQHDGGGIYNDGGTVTLSDTSSVTDNSCDQYYGGGGIFNNGGTVTLKDTSSVSGNGAASGGGIYNTGTLTLSGNSSVSGNEADDGGGILNTGTVTMSDTSRVSSNNADVGGGILNGGTLINCIAGGNVVNNTVSDIFNE